MWSLVNSEEMRWDRKNQGVPLKAVRGTSVLPRKGKVSSLGDEDQDKSITRYYYKVVAQHARSNDNCCSDTIGRSPTTVKHAGPFHPKTLIRKIAFLPVYE